MTSPISVAARSKTSVCSHSLAEIAGSIPAGDVDICLLGLLRVVRQRTVCRADHSPRGVLQSVVYLSAITKSRQ